MKRTKIYNLLREHPYGMRLSTIVNDTGVDRMRVLHELILMKKENLVTVEDFEDRANMEFYSLYKIKE